MYPPKPFPNSYWLKTKQLLAGPLPSSQRQTGLQDRLISLLASGIRVFVNLLEIEEFERSNFFFDQVPTYDKELKKLAKTKGIDIICHRFTIVDMGIPTIALMRQILDTIDENLAANRPVYFHCFAGLGRTGTVAGCWLVRQGLSGNEALEKLQEIRSIQGAANYGRSPQNNLQIDFVLNWQQGW